MGLQVFRVEDEVSSSKILEILSKSRVVNCQLRSSKEGRRLVVVVAKS